MKRDAKLVISAVRKVELMCHEIRLMMVSYRKGAEQGMVDLEHVYDVGEVAQRLQNVRDDAAAKLATHGGLPTKAADGVWRPVGKR